MIRQRKYVDGRFMRYGYTTGSCAAAAAKAGAQLLICGEASGTVAIRTRSGEGLNLMVEYADLLPREEIFGGNDRLGGFPCGWKAGSHRAVCAVRKDAGDDPDVTHGALIFAEVACEIAETASAPGFDFDSESRDSASARGFGLSPHPSVADGAQRSASSGAGELSAASDSDARIRTGSEEDGFQLQIEIDGGRGIGRVTKPGLDQPVGAAAINSGPREMIRNSVAEAFAAFWDDGGERDRECLRGKTLKITVILSVPDGEALGKRTFNPMMGIVGGISILGTTGIVEPMSDQAVAGTIETEVRVIAAQGYDRLMINLGNYGENYTKEVLRLRSEPAVKCANFIGTAMDAAVAEGMNKILLVGHIGKLVKLGISMFNTHSNNGDGRLETLAACSIEAGAESETVRAVLGCVTTEAAIEVLESAGRLDAVLHALKVRIRAAIDRHIPNTVAMEFVCFSGKIGQWRTLFQSDGAEEMAALWRQGARAATGEGSP